MQRKRQTLVFLNNKKSRHFGRGGGSNRKPTTYGILQSAWYHTGGYDNASKLSCPQTTAFWLKHIRCASKHYLQTSHCCHIS